MLIIFFFFFLSEVSIHPSFFTYKMCSQGLLWSANHSISRPLFVNLDWAQYSMWRSAWKNFITSKNLLNFGHSIKSKEYLNLFGFYTWEKHLSDSSSLHLLQVKYDFLYEKVHVCCLEEWASPIYQKIYTTFILVILFLLPLMLMLFLYTKIGYELWIKKRVGDASVLQTIHGSEMSKISRFVNKIHLELWFTGSFFSSLFLFLWNRLENALQDMLMSCCKMFCCPRKEKWSARFMWWCIFLLFPRELCPSEHSLRVLFASTAIRAWSQV